MIAGSRCIVIADRLPERYSPRMSAQVTDPVLILPINGDRELNVISDSKGRRVKFVLKKKHSDSYQVREEWFLSSKSSMKLAMYLAGIRDAMRRLDFDDEEPTLDDVLKKIRGE